MATSNTFQNKILRIVIKEPNGRLDKVIVNSIPQDVGLSRSRVKNLIKFGAIKTEKDNKKIHQKYQVQKNEALLINLIEPLVSVALPEDMPLEIIFEDDHLIVINKPPGLVVHPGSGVYGGTLVNALMNHCNNLADVGESDRPGIVHRLDKDTSGLLVVAKSNHAYLGLIKQFAQHTAKRQYLAILWGLPDLNNTPLGIGNLLSLEEKGVLKIEGNIGRHPVHRKKMALRKDGGGKEALTKYKILRTFVYKDIPIASLTSCWLATGRTHQIRVHMDAINHGVVGDLLYRSGMKSNLDLSKILGGVYDTFRRQALHAEKLSFEHPLSKEHLQFEVSPPKDFCELLRAFEKL